MGADSKNLRSLLRNNKHFNPFSDSFNFKQSLEDAKLYEEKSESSLEDDKYALSILENSKFFNDYFVDLYAYMKEIINESNISVEDILKYIISISNLDTCKIDEEYEKYFKNNTDIRIEGIASFEIENSNSLSGLPMNASAMYEVQPDILNLLINYLRYFSNDNKRHNNFDPYNLQEISVKIYRLANILHLVKEAYDTVLWENGKIENKDGKLHFKHIDDDYSVLKRVGILRLFRNVLANKAMLNRNYDPVLIKEILNKGNAVSLSGVEINYRGFVICKYKKENEAKPDLNSYWSAYSSIIAFYPHLTNKPLKNICNLTVDNLTYLHSELVSLGKAILKETKNRDNSKLKNFSIRIKKKDLIEYFLKVTNFSKEEVISYLSLIESEFSLKQRVNLWEKPLVNINNVYFICLPALLYPNYLPLIDTWLENAGYTLKFRGTALEVHVKDSLHLFLKEKGSYLIPNINKFSVSKQKHEEIDLIISFDDLIIIGEIKNIKYPMEARDYHNSLKILKKGAEQLQRKKCFILENSEKFSSMLNGIEGKEIYSVVITNYTHFTGMSIEGVPIMDFLAFQTYMNSGQLIDIREYPDGTNEPIRETNLWNNNKEFFDNINNYLIEPTVVNIVRQNVIQKEFKITPEGFYPEMYLHTADATI
ncbi:hypothetical protein [Paenibacillus amylolyticus]|uniref:NERD domain-containing protein n=1 Tax=Paenibacillus amylolyticus TaxID=1451 RepID=A0A100VM51_PAEAM|nr:hypothetical protein [Paenibacillus amylolyticus]GAS82405.1 unknown protein [Paenibacillus amylolyticus]